MSKRPKAITQSFYTQLFPQQLRKSDYTKIAIIEGAVETYANIGIDYISYEDIARATKLTRPLVQHYFPSKRELFIFSIRYIRALFQNMAVEAINSRPDFEGKFQEYMWCSFSWFEKHPKHVKTWLFFFYHCGSDSGLREIHRELTSMGSDRIEALIDGGVKLGLFEVHSRQDTAKAIQNLITGALVELATELGTHKIEEVKIRTYQTALQLLNYKK